ncbi:response regulator transcription factor [Aquimarina sp. 2201CG5-10]|uniref:response regulator transcription factor n=1 Tax=Aquimarina callyspongiae TaxID=3098150 RepID=UPI002AB40192|nr:response regulator transcription factor [Aquimarina sp. 2201CG5-10]MDY8138172.1 response regulator transcription factor [Aquimarina sp. 2201CG5-10]
MIKIILVDDHFMVRDGIRAILEEEEQYEVIGEASNGAEAIRLTKSLMPDVVVCDINMPEMTGIEAVQQITSLDVPARTIMLSMHDSDEYILQSVKAGADGYLLKDAGKDEFLKALSMVSRGEKYFSGDVSSVLVEKIRAEKDLVYNTSSNTPSKTWSKVSVTSVENPFELTKRENQILHMAVSGMTNKDIAAQLNISKRTIEVHRFNLMKKMGVKNVLELSNKAREYKLIS